MNRLNELCLDLIEVMAYRELQVPGGEGSEDAYYEMAIQSLKSEITNEYHSCEPQIKENRKDRNRYRLNKKAKQKGKHIKHKRSVEAVSKQREFKRKLRRIPVGQEEFRLKGCGYHRVYEWTWDVD